MQTIPVGTYEVDGQHVVLTPDAALVLRQPGGIATVEVAGRPAEQMLVRAVDVAAGSDHVYSFRLEQVLSKMDVNGVLRPVVSTGPDRRYTVETDHTSYDYAGNEEATRDPIFLLQKRQIYGIKQDSLDASDTYFNGDRLVVSAEHFDKKEILQASKDGDLLTQSSEPDMPFDLGVAVGDKVLVERDWVHTGWETIGVFRTREEAEDYGMRQRHNLGEKNEDWQVYCIPCEGQLADIVKRIDRDELVTFIQTDAFKQALKVWREQEAQKL